MRKHYAICILGMVYVSSWATPFLPPEPVVPIAPYLPAFQPDTAQMIGKRPALQSHSEARVLRVSTLFTSAVTAQTLVHKLQQAGLPAYVVKKQPPSLLKGLDAKAWQMTYQILIGPFLDPARVQVMQERLSQQFHLTAHLQSWEFTQ